MRMPSARPGYAPLAHAGRRHNVHRPELPMCPSLHSSSHFSIGHSRHLGGSIHRTSWWANGGLFLTLGTRHRHASGLAAAAVAYRDADGLPPLDYLVSTGADSWSGVIDRGDLTGSCRIHRLCHGLTSRLQCREIASVLIERHCPVMAGLVSTYREV